MADEKPIIVIKKKGGHGGHHGGAWKVAYADFVTAMMAFFMVMWLLNSASEVTRQNIASYFRRPGLFTSGSGTPLLIGESGILRDAYVPPRPEDKAFKAGVDQSPKDTRSGSDKDKIKRQIKNKEEKAKGIIKGKEDTQGVKVKEQKELSGISPTAKEAMEKLAEEIKQQIESSPDLKKLLGIVDVKINADGLNIEIMDSEKVSMFNLGGSIILPEAREAFTKLAGMLLKLPNSIEIVGHTDAKPFAIRPGGLSNWELSSERANAARRLLEAEGIPPERITSVIGRADRELRNPSDPFAASNRRITLKMKFKFTKTIDLAKQPEALKEIEKPLEQAAIEQAAAPPTPAPAHGYMPKILREAIQKQKDTVPLPDEVPFEAVEPGVNSVPTPESKLFKDNPVTGPADPFANL